MKRYILLVVALLITMHSFSQIREIKETYFKIRDNQTKKVHSGNQHFTEPLYSYFISSKDNYYPAYFYGRNYESIYIFKKGRLVECKNFTKYKQKEIVQFNYDKDGDLTAVHTQEKNITYEYLYEKNLAKLSFGGDAYEIHSRDNYVYKMNGGKIGTLYFYHDVVNNTVETFLPRRQRKQLIYYNNGRAYKIEEYTKGELKKSISITYKNDIKGNWIEKRITYPDRVYITKRKISYL